MKMVTNRFGTRNIYTIEDLKYPIYCESAACLGVYTDFLSWVSSDFNSDACTTDPSCAKSIIVLGCQVTDLAIINDIRIAERLREQNPNADIYMSGCLGQRFDIELPSFIRRLDVVRVLNQPIKQVAMEKTVYAKPFWVEELDENDDYAPGNLFRNAYWIKIGAGCHGKCKYCTIRDTRGDCFEMDAEVQKSEFLAHDNVVLISDSPTYKQVQDWCNIALQANKSFSIRNIEPHITNACKDKLLQVAKEGLLLVFHCPIQSMDIRVIEDMNRPVSETLAAIDFMQELRACGTKVATNIIIDYTLDDKVYRNMPIEELNNLFDYWSWNPYFDGEWDRQKAEVRFDKYIVKGEF